MGYERNSHPRGGRMDITYSLERRPTPEQVADLFRCSGLRRPVDQLDRIEAMLEHADLLVTAWHGEALIGVARALTDWRYCCYLSDLAVTPSHQRQGIGRALIRQVQSAIGPECMLLLLAAPEAMDYYPHIGFEPAPNAWIIHRSV